MATSGYSITLTPEEKARLLELVQSKCIELIGDERVLYKDLTSLIEIKDKLENAVKCYS